MLLGASGFAYTCSCNLTPLTENLPIHFLHTNLLYPLLQFSPECTAKEIPGNWKLQTTLKYTYSCSLITIIGQLKIQIPFKAKYKCFPKSSNCKKIIAFIVFSKQEKHMSFGLYQLIVTILLCNSNLVYSNIIKGFKYH